MTRSSACWCGNTSLTPFSPHYLRCPVCETLVTAEMPAPEFTAVHNDEQDFYGREYWFSHQEEDLGQANIVERARADMPERALYWLRTLLKYKLPPGDVLELGSAHGGFVALLRWAGFEATGLELSPAIVEYAKQTFGVPMLLGPVEEQNIAPGSLDAIALMDVLEHLPDPIGTMRHSLSLLKPDGILLIQTPRYAEAKTFAAMEAERDPFLIQLKHEQHLYLFSRSSARDLFQRLGAEHIAFEPAIFAHYDMFVVVSRTPLAETNLEEPYHRLLGTANNRMVQALIDLDDARLRVGKQLQDAHRDRAARLALIEQQGAKLGRIPKLEADIEYLKRQLITAEGDRAARQSVIERQGAELGQMQGDVAQVIQLLKQASAIPHFGIVLPHEVKQMRNLLSNTLSILSRRKHNQGEPAQVAAPKDAKPNMPAANVHEPLSQESAFVQLREPKTLKPFVYSQKVIDQIIGGLRKQGFTVKDFTLNPEEYRAYFAAAEYTKRYPKYYDFNISEKSLEHFIAAKLLELNPSDVYIDIASEHSPVPEIYSRLFGAKSYRQDLAYPEGLNGDKIGGDAAAMAVPDGFASKMALHCSFEHFEGDADIRFVREVERVLRSGGRVCFAPIYLFHEYGILTDPVVAVSQNVAFESDATIYAKPGWLNRHGRFYDPAHLASRVQKQLGTMQMTIYRITNATDVDPTCYIQFAAVITKP